jgi:transcriptional regulator NrdR family protein
MECPFCGKIENDVIDSRSTPEGTAIRRRRKCSGCAGRFTTYESTPEHFLFLLMKQHTPKGSSIKSPKAALAFMSNAFKGLSEGIEKLAVKVDKPEAVKVVKKPRRKVAAKAKPKKRTPVYHQIKEQNGLCRQQA